MKIKAFSSKNNRIGTDLAKADKSGNIEEMQNSASKVGRKVSALGKIRENQ